VLEANQRPTSKGALEGIRVIDLTVWFQGPVCAQHLADFGADVIKVERPKGGDQGRGVMSLKALPVGDWNQYFLVINRNKRSVALDLKTEEGRAIMYRMVESSDVFLSNLSPALLQSWGLDYAKLREVNPGIVYAMNTGYGPHGSADRPSFDMTVQALTGIMARLGEPGEPPIYLGMGSGDAYGGLMSALGILIALHSRRRTGRGQMLDASLYGAQLFLVAPALQAYLATGDRRLARQQSRRDRPQPLRNAFPTADGWVVLALDESAGAWSSLCSTLEDDGLASDPRFEDAPLRRRNGSELVARLDEILASRSTKEWMSRWQSAGLRASPIRTYEDLAADPQAWQNRYLMTTHCEDVDREVDIRGLPIGLSETPGAVEKLGPELGEHTEILLTELFGYTWDDIERFKACGAIP
jgi:crotonobetainyl-CoA:carnitine CoA-transferase CaiB-like acyl-CoA transferase